MTKNEAISKIKELQEFVNSIPDNKHPNYELGQVFRHQCGDMYLVRYSDDSSLLNTKFVLTALDNGVGKNYAAPQFFGGQEQKFTYVGMFQDLFERVFFVISAPNLSDQGAGKPGSAETRCSTAEIINQEIKL